MVMNLSNPMNRPDGVMLNASPRLADLLRSEPGMSEELFLRNGMTIVPCTTCGEKVVILVGSPDTCMQCFLGTERITTENIELVTNMEMTLNQHEFRVAFDAWVNEMGMSPDDYYLSTAKMVLKRVPVDYPDEHVDGMSAAMVKVLQEHWDDEEESPLRSTLIALLESRCIVIRNGEMQVYKKWDPELEQAVDLPEGYDLPDLFHDLELTPPIT